MLALILATPATCAQDAAPSKFSVWLPGKLWTLELTAPGYTLRNNEMQPDGRRYFLAEDAKARALVSVYLGAGKGPATLEECKRSLEDRAKRDSPLERKHVEYREISGMETIAYTIPEVDGVPLNQRNVFACLIKDDVYVDIHLSKRLFKAADQPLFDAILQSVAIVPKETAAADVPAGDSVDLFRQGSRFFLARQYRQAIGPYQKALDIEKSTPTLDKNTWRVLVDNLGVSYGVTGDLDRAKEIFDYGVSQDPAYPLFYYNLACGAAEKRDVNDAKAFLQMAFDNRDNMIPGERFPDPRVDESFQRLLLLDKGFRQWVDSLWGGPN
jgi:tetratricopeptide (TPR) repeat protein